jgi:hypothetical protein
LKTGDIGYLRLFNVDPPRSGCILLLASSVPHTHLCDVNIKADVTVALQQQTASPKPWVLAWRVQAVFK